MKATDQVKTFRWKFISSLLSNKLEMCTHAKVYHLCVVHLQFLTEQKIMRIETMTKGGRQAQLFDSAMELRKIQAFAQGCVSAGVFPTLYPKP